MAPRTRSAEIREGYRSGLEESTDADLRSRGVSFEYETHVIRYEQPARMSRYTPDFILPNGIIIETKGRFIAKDRQKHLLVKAQHPDLDIRFVFSNPKSWLTKNKKTSYAMWCERHGFLFAKKIIPEAWLQEPLNPAAIEALEKAGMK